MIEVLLLNDRKKNNYGKEIFSVLSEKLSGIYISDKEFIKKGKYPMILLAEKSEFKSIDNKNYIVIVGETDKSIDFNEFKNAHTVIMQSDISRNIISFDKTDFQVIFCGMSVRDTVTLSGVIGDSSTVSFNRTAVKLNGGEISENDIIICNKGYNDFSIMAAGAVLSLL